MHTSTYFAYKQNQYFFFLLLAQRQQHQHQQQQQKMDQNDWHYGTGEAEKRYVKQSGKLFSKCFYNCSCNCCLNGCCIEANCCSCCNCLQRRCCCLLSCLKNQRQKPQLFLPEILLNTFINALSEFLQLVYKIFCTAWPHKQRVPSSRPHHIKDAFTVATVAAASSAATTAKTTSGTSIIDAKLKDQYCQFIYDQQQKINILCKVFSNIRKRQRRRRRRRKRRRRRHKKANVSCNWFSVTNCKDQHHQQQQQQQRCAQLHNEKNISCQIWHHMQNVKLFTIIWLKALKAIIRITPVLSTMCNLVTTLNPNINSTHTKWQAFVHMQASQKFLLAAVKMTFTCSHTPLTKTKRANANFVWLLIGLIWIESPKMLNCNVISTSGWPMLLPLTQQQQPTTKPTTRPSTASSNNKALFPSYRYGSNFTQKRLTSHKCAHTQRTSDQQAANLSKQYLTPKRRGFNKIQISRTTLNQSFSPKLNEKPLSINYTLVRIKDCSQCQSNVVRHFNLLDTEHTDHHNYINKNTSNQNRNFNNIVLSDRVRLESIKRQILTKLGLTQKPNVSHPLPKQFIWDTIYRANGFTSVSKATNQDPGVYARQKAMHWRFQQSAENNIYSDNNERRHAGMGSAHKMRSQYGKRIFYPPYHHHSNNNRNYSHEGFLNNYTISTTTTSNTLHQESDKNSQRGHLYKFYSNNIKYQKRRRNNIDNNVSNRSKPYNKSTYLININRSSDSSINNGSNKISRYNEFLYLNNYSVLTESITSYLAASHIDQTHLRGIGKSRIYHQLHLDLQGLQEDYDLLELEDYFGNTQEIITFAEKGTMYRQHRLVEFSTQSKQGSSQRIFIRSAEIHIRIDQNVAMRVNEKMRHSGRQNHKNHTRKKHRLKIWIFQIPIGSNATGQVFDEISHFCASFDVDADSLGWQKLDITDTVREWHAKNAHMHNLKLLIDCTGCGNQYRLHLFEPDNQATQSGELKLNNYQQQQPELKNVVSQINPYQPFLVLHVEARRLRRVRRRAVDCAGALNGQCCKESFYVSFKALGWDDWIVAPRGYFANYCRGECNGPFRTPDTFQTFHAHFIEEYRKMGLLNGMKPCCAPVKFSSMSLIYYGDDGIIKRDLPKMVVDECGCP